MTKIQFPLVGAQIFLFVSTPDRLWTQPASHQLVKGGFSPIGTASDREVHHLPVFSAEINNAWSCSSTPAYTFVALCLMRKRRNFALCYCWLLHLIH
jgi:hypothetical protein